jgi:hypothetical protein
LNPSSITVWAASQCESLIIKKKEGAVIKVAPKTKCIFIIRGGVLQECDLKQLIFRITDENINKNKTRFNRERTYIFKIVHEFKILWCRFCLALPSGHVSKESVQARGLVQHFATSCFLLRGVISPMPNTPSRRTPLVGRPRLLIQYIRSYPQYPEAVSSIRNLRTRHVVVTRDRLNI